MSPSTPLATRQADCHPDRPRHARGLCVNCYQRARHNGTLRHHPRIRFSSDRPCPCGESGYSRGLCVWHYRWRYEKRSGDPAVATIPDVNHLVAADEAAGYDRRRPVMTVCGMRVFPVADAVAMPGCPACEVARQGAADG